MGRGPRCPTWPSGIRRSVAGRKDCSAAPIRMLWWWRSPTSWRGSPGQCCVAENGLPLRECSDGVTFCCFSAACAEKRMIVCERWKARCDPPPRKWSDLRYVFDRWCRKSRRSFGVCPGLHWRGDYEPVLAVVCGLIGIGGHLAVPPLPHHRAYGSVPRRFDQVKRWRAHRVGEDRVRRRSDCAGLVGPPGVLTCARGPSVIRRQSLP